MLPLLRRRSAALRHALLASAFACAAAAPLLGLLAPSWRVPAPALAPVGPSLAPVRPVEGTAVSAGVQTAAHADGPGQFPWTTAALSAWALGAVGGLGLLAVGAARLARVSAAAREVKTGAWPRHVEDLKQRWGLTRPVRILQSDHAGLLVTWGIWKPAILLPAAAASWSEDRIRSVVAHELAHVVRRDWVITIGAEVLKAIHWFNPVVWIACRRLRDESERACDDMVLGQGCESVDYASQLVGIARELHRSRTWVPAPSVARCTSLERRVTAMLDPLVNRGPVSRSARAATWLAALAIALPVTGAAMSQVFSTLAGSIVDPTKGALPGVTLVLTNAQSGAKHEVKTDSTGRYEVVGLPSGDYQLEARLPGFSVLRGTVTVGGGSLQRDLTMEVGTLQETINVRASANRTDTAAPMAQSAARPAPRPCETPSSQGGIMIGGQLRPPVKLRHVNPVYPASALAAGAQGTVTLRARIGTEGDVEEATVVSSPHPDLAAAAVAAVRQWEFGTTLLNCVAIPVEMGVTVNFEREP
jgi:TonB family protein